MNSFKPLHLEAGPEKSAVQSVDNSDGFISFIDNDGLEKKLLISYYSVPDLPDLSGGNENGGILKENATESSDVTSDLNGLKNEDIEIKSELTKENNVKPFEVEKRTRHNQTMRLAQFSSQDVETIIKQFKERFLKHVNCLHCGFTAKNSRSLSVHMTRLHK